jgi:hypothetical protein
MGKGIPLGRAEFIKRARDIHGDRYNYDQVIYTTINTHVIIVCPIHGPFQQKAGKHLEGRGCPICARISRNWKTTTAAGILSAKYDNEVLLALFRRRHGDAYTYDLSAYKNMDSYIKIFCEKHNRHFTQQVKRHKEGQTGCLTCAKEKAKAKKDAYALLCIGREMKSPRGYCYIYVGRGNEHKYKTGNNSHDGYVPTHIFTMSNHLQRPIQADYESVHHKNGIRNDNRLENLELRHRYHGSGQGVQEKIDQSLVFLYTYREMITEEQTSMIRKLLPPLPPE